MGRKIVSVEYLPPNVLHPADLRDVQVLKVGETLRQSDVSTAVDRLFATGHFDDIVVEAEPSGDGVAVRFVTTPENFIVGVTVDGKLSQPPNRGEVASAARFALGTPFEEQDVSRAVTRIKRLMTSNGLYQAQVDPDVEIRPNQQVFITFHVKDGKRAKYDVPVIHGETKLSDSAILRATGWRVPFINFWRKVTASRTRKGIQGVLGKYQKQDRLTAHVELEKLDYNPERRRVTPRLNINAGPKISVKAVEAKVSKRVMRRYVPVYQERAVDNDLLVEGARNLRDYFQSKGYYDVDVDFRTRPVVNDEQTIEYVISQGQRFKMTALTITGAKYFTESDFRERMFLQPATFTMRRGRYSEAFRKKDEENIASLYKANGFRDAKVTSTVVRDYEGKAGHIGVTIQIEEGPQWVVDKVTLTGIEQGNQEELESDLASLPGQPFSEVNMAADRSVILTWYFAHGFPTADLKAAWQPSEEPHHVNVFYTVTEGERQYIREVITSGLKTTRQSMVDKRIATLKPGAPLSPLAQNGVQRTFYDLGVFSRVDTAIENAEGETNHKNLLYNFEEANRYVLALGFGAQIGQFGTTSTTSLSAPAGTTGFSPQASMNLSRLNTWGIGHTVTLRGIYSNLQKRASISYLAPRFQNVEGRNITVSLFYDDSRNVRTFSSKQQEASIQISQRFTKSTSGIFRLAYRRSSVTDVVIPVLLVPQLLQPVRLGIISANIVQDRRDDPSNPKRGIYNTGDVSVAPRFLGSERSFVRVLLRNATYHALTRNVILARQTQLGAIVPFNAPRGIVESQSIPLPERFFGGGAESLRAFPYNQAGPRDTGEPIAFGQPPSRPTGFPLGGNALLFNNVELRFPLLGPNIQGVFFHDMGNVYSTFGDISFRFRQRDLQDFNYMVHAVGFGVRYRTPVGPIRGDIAYSFNPPSFLGFSGTAQEILQCDPTKPISELPSFCQSTRQSIGHVQFFFSIGQTF